MMESAYRMVSANGWSFYLIGAAYFGCLAWFLRSRNHRRTFFIFWGGHEQIARTAAFCRRNTGFISAVLTRYTALITINILIFNMLLNLIHYAPAGSGMMQQLSHPVEILYAVCASCLVSIVVLLASIFAICAEVIRQTEEEE